MRQFGRVAAQVLRSLVTMLLLVGCRGEMFQQPKSNPLEASEFFSDQMSARPLVPGTVAREAFHADAVFETGKHGTNLVDRLPLPLTRDLLDRGRERFDIYCAVCHGRTGTGDGMIVERGFPHPPSYHIDRLRAAPIGHFYDVMSRGYGVMYSYAAVLEPRDRWAIAAYIRALQLSQNTKLSDLSEKEKAALEATLR